MNLRAYILERGMTYEAAAALLGNVSRSAVIKWCRGERIPMPDQLRRIYEVTEGRVTPNDFVLSQEATP